MKAQVEVLKRLFPGFIVKQPTEYDDREERSDAVRGVFTSESGKPLHDQCKALEKEMNTVVAPEVVVGKVATGALRCAIPSLELPQLTFPLTYKAAGDLHKRLDPSKVGVELRGDVLDTDLRRSHEILASKMEMPQQLRDFDFPAEVARIHQTLCPSAESIRIEPYKLILYRAGDFFVPHRDSMDEEDMFGTISIGLPVHPPAEGEEKEEAGEEGSQRGGGGYADSDEQRPGGPGQLVLYVGYRASDESIPSYLREEEVIKPNTLTHVVDMESVVTPAPADGDVAVTMSYGAWTGDVLHEVRRLESGYRAVLTYRLYKQGHRDSYIPAELRTSVEAKVRAIVPALAALQLPEDDREKGVLPTNFLLGFSLRHAYPPAGLRPQSLKGVDAILYSIVSGVYETALFTGYDVRDQDMYETHALPTNLYTRIVHLTADQPDTRFCDEEAREQMAAKYPVVANTVWVSLGYGALLGGGFCYGNMDCGTDWWYRQAYLLVDPSKPVPPATEKSS